MATFLYSCPDLVHSNRPVAIFDYTGVDSAYGISDEWKIPYNSTKLLMAMSCIAKVFDPYMLLTSFDEIECKYKVPIYQWNGGEKIPSGVDPRTLRQIYFRLSELVQILRILMRSSTDEIPDWVWRSNIDLDRKNDTILDTIKILTGFIRSNPECVGIPVPTLAFTNDDLHRLQTSLRELRDNVSL